MAVRSTAKLLERCLVTGIAAGAALGACFMLGLVMLELLSANSPEPEVVPIAVAVAALVGAVAGAPVGLVAGIAAKGPIAHGSATTARTIVGSVGAIGAGATIYLVYGPLLGPGQESAHLGVAVAVVMLVAAVTGWLATAVLLRPQD